MISILPPAKLIHERYRVVQLLGQGGFGAVYEALDLRLNRRVALKQLLHINERISRQFAREAQLLANLQHPALPRVTDHFTDPAGQFLVMDFIPGADLASLLLQRDAPFPVDQVYGWAAQLLDALHYLHTRQPPIIHRDIKPQNLKLQDDGRLLLLDFGLAKGSAGDVAPSTAESSLLAYTKGYAPPEQIEGSGTDARSDLYALGATLYYLLTNSPPVEAQMRLLAEARQRPDPLRPAHLRNPAVPIALSQALAQALALPPQQRPESALALRGLIDRAMGDHPQAGSATPAPGAPPPTAPAAGQLGSPPPVPRLALAAEPRLHIVAHDGVRQSITLTGQGITVGRADDNDLVLAERAVSAHHLLVTWDGRQAAVTDLGSSNGTWLANRKLAPHVPSSWSPQDWLAAGPIWLRLQTPVAPSIPATHIDSTVIDPAVSAAGLVGASALAAPDPPARAIQSRRRSRMLWLTLGGAILAVAALLVLALRNAVTPIAVAEQSPPSTAQPSLAALAGGATQAPTNIVPPTATPTAVPSTATPTPVPPTATPTRTAAPTVTATPAAPEDLARQVILAYFQAINARDYRAAYNSFGAEFQQQQSFASFAAGFEATERDDVEIVAVEPAAADRYSVTVRLTAYQTDDSIKRFAGAYFVGKEYGAWKILDANLTEE